METYVLSAKSTEIFKFGVGTFSTIPRSQENKVDVSNDLRAEMFPHHMGKSSDISYCSSSILGKIYDTVQEFHDEALPRRQELWKLPCFDISISEKHKRDDGVANEMHETQLLYEAPDMEESAKDTQVIYEEAVAIYHVTYDYASVYGVEKCRFAWKVAGSALCNLCAWNSAARKEKPVELRTGQLSVSVGQEMTMGKECSSAISVRCGSIRTAVVLNNLKKCQDCPSVRCAVVRL
ncbi:hypothetical protein C2S51_021772 [Perilla frutescens var. frutescens]|nr:hypothetical protein C2S51_021772 [Perilla frutescens var. frutescens]